MILVDTSVWVDHFISPNRALVHLLDLGEVVTHPFVIGELTMGSRPKSNPVVLLFRIEKTIKATDPEVLQFVANHKLHGVGIGYLDAHLLASAAMTPETKLWTRDKRLAAAALRLSLHYAPLLN